MLKKSDYLYELPKELIAQTPQEERSASRLLMLNKDTGEYKDLFFRDFLHLIKKGDCLVFNDTKVIPARIFGIAGNSPVEVLLLRRLSADTWDALVKPGAKMRIGDAAVFADGALACRVSGIKEGGVRELVFKYNGVFEEILDSIGEIPLPPYITEKLRDKDRYQTVYAKHEGAAAAPTAGLHFTREIMEQLTDMGVVSAYITLHVGLGTFRPVKAENISEHKMHEEWYCISENESKKINAARRAGGRIIAVGTTSVRALESAADKEGLIKANSGTTDIFIYPGYIFKAADGLLTNFHLPGSTLIMLVSALAGRESVLAAYKYAVEQQYRFFSFGDAMLVM